MAMATVLPRRTNGSRCRPAESMSAPASSAIWKPERGAQALDSPLPRSWRPRNGAWRCVPRPKSSNWSLRTDKSWESLRETVQAQRASGHGWAWRSVEHTYELQSIMRISYAVFGLQKKKIMNQDE